MNKELDENIQEKNNILVEYRLINEEIKKCLKGTDEFFNQNESKKWNKKKYHLRECGYINLDSTEKLSTVGTNE